MSDAAFPLTRPSVLEALKADDSELRERAFGALVLAAGVQVPAAALAIGSALTAAFRA